MRRLLLDVLDVLTAILYLALIVALIAAGACAKPHCYDLPLARAGQDTLTRTCVT